LGQGEDDLDDIGGSAFKTIPLEMKMKIGVMHLFHKQESDYNSSGCFPFSPAFNANQ
jgi:hypothetical protein